MILMNNIFQYKVERVKTDKAVTTLYQTSILKGNEITLVMPWKGWSQYPIFL